MPVRRRVPKGRLELTPGQEAWLRGEKPDGADAAYQTWVEFVWLSAAWRDDNPSGGPTARQLWLDYGDQVVEDHTAEFPGTRPGNWWRFSAPGPRQRVGGIGTPLHEFTAYALQLECGVPVWWLTRAMASHGFLRPIVDWPAIDPTNPPRFESTPTYLDRHGLLLPGERRRLREEDFRPEPITDILDLERE